MCTDRVQRESRTPLVRRLVWYSLAAVLLLSLPTFSYLHPRVSLPLERIVTGVGLGGMWPVPHRADLAAAAGSRAEARPESLPSRPGFVSGSVAGRGPLRQDEFSVFPAAVESEPAAMLDSAGPSRERTRGFPAMGIEEDENLRLLGDLHRMESEFSALASVLFPSTYGAVGGAASANPFQDALNGEPATNNDPKPPDNPGGGTVIPTDGGGDGEGEGDGNNNPPDNPPPDSGSEEPELASSTAFLLLGPFGSSREEVAFRATRVPGGPVVLENGILLNVFSGVVAGGRRMMVVEGDQQLVTADVLRDGLMDLFVTLRDVVGTALFGYRSEAGGAVFREWLFGFFLYDLVDSFALFDYDGDGLEELVVASAKNPNLVIYRIQNGQITYLRELTIPLDPYLLAVTRDPVRPDQSYLQVFDRELKTFVTFTSRYPGVYTFSKPASFRRFEDVLVPDEAQGITRQYRLILYFDRIVLTEVTAAGFKILGSFDTLPAIPTVLVGDFLSKGTQQVVFLP